MLPFAKSMIFINEDVVAGALTDKTIGLRNITTQDTFGFLKGHTDEVNTLALSEDKKILVSGSNDKTIKLWDYGDLRCTKTLEGHKAPIHLLQLAVDSSFIISADISGEIRMWDLPSGKVRKTIQLSNVIDLRLSPGKDQFIVAYKNKDVGFNLDLCWISKEKPDWTYQNKTHNVSKLAIAPYGFDLFAATDKGFVVVDVIKDTVKDIPSKEGAVTAMAFSEFGDILLAGHKSGFLSVWPTQHTNIVSTLSFSKKPISAVTICTTKNMASVSDVAGLCAYIQLEVYHNPV